MVFCSQTESFYIRFAIFTPGGSMSANAVYNTYAVKRMIRR
jgi:hypothetical protein